MSRKLFTKEEDSILIDKYSTLSNTELESIFEGRHTREQIKWRAKALGLNKVPKTMVRINATKAGTWTEEEKNLLREQYPIGGLEFLVESLGRSPSNIRHKAFRMGIHLDYEVFCQHCANGPKHHTDEAKEKISQANKGKEFTEEHKRKIGDAQRGEKNHGWKDGSSFLPYPAEFNNKLKRRIRKRDFHQCVLCNSKIKLVIHHIDEDKNNCVESNLITLCLPCHNKYHTSKDQELVYNMKMFFLEHVGSVS